MAIIGRGDIASAIKDRDGFTFFASGVSNRFPLDLGNMCGELSRILYTDTDTMLVYISTLSIYYADNFYVHHKINIENKVKGIFPNHCILRIGNITWGDNPNTLINHLKKDQSRIDDTYRYLIDKEELNHWIGLIPTSGKHEMNITGRRMKVSEIVQEIKDGKL